MVETVESQPFPDRMASLKVSREQLLVIVSARAGSVSYDSAFDRLPALINKNFAENSLLILYPEQVDRQGVVSFTDPLGNA